MVGIAIPNAQKVDSFEKNLTVAILDECGLALEKELTARAKQQIEELAHQETLRANLLRAISHDLRTPLTSISGNAGILMENGAVLDEEKRRYLYRSIYDDSMWLINLVENLLSLTRMGNGSVSLNIRPELLDEVFHEALSHLDRNAEQHHISVELEDDLLMAGYGRPAHRPGGHQSGQQRHQVHPCRFPHLLVRCPGRSFCAGRGLR